MIGDVFVFDRVDNSLSIAPRQSWPFVLDTASKFALFSESGLKDEKVIKSANVSG